LKVLGQYARTPRFARWHFSFFHYISLTLDFLSIDIAFPLAPFQVSNNTAYRHLRHKTQANPHTMVPGLCACTASKWGHKTVLLLYIIFRFYQMYKCYNLKFNVIVRHLKSWNDWCAFEQSNDIEP
jgi:hypothetical protein